MDCVNNESIYLKESEWKFFLAGLGFTEVYGLFSEEKEDADREFHMYRMLADLYQRGMISCEGKQIIVLPPVSDFLEIMQKSKKCVILRRSEKEYPVRCCYITNTSVLIMEKSQRELSAIRLKQMSVEDWKKDIFAAVAEEDEEMQIFLQDSRKNLLYEKIIFKEEGLRSYLIIENKNGQKQVEYQSDVLDKKIREWIM